MSRLLLPVAGIVIFFLLSLVTVRTLKPRQPRLFFMGYAALLLLASAYVYVQLWPLGSLDDGAGLLACLLLQTLLCLTMWNAFSPCSSPSLMKGSSTRYSSSLLLKNAHTWRDRSRTAPPRWTGCLKAFMKILDGLFGLSGEREQIAELVVAAQQLAPH